MRGETAARLKIMYQWLTHEKGQATFSCCCQQKDSKNSFDNAQTLLRLDELEIGYLLDEIKVLNPEKSTLIQIFSAFWVNKVTPTYDLWESAARSELGIPGKALWSCVTGSCQRDFNKNVMGIAEFLKRKVAIYMVDRMIRPLFHARELIIGTDYKGWKVPFL